MFTHFFTVRRVKLMFLYAINYNDFPNNDMNVLKKVFQKNNRIILFHYFAKIIGKDIEQI